MSNSERAAAHLAPGNENRGQGTCPNCGCDLDGKAGKVPRSVPQLRRYFAMIKAAFLHWPENAERQFASPDELRAYLQMKAGHREIGATIPIAGMSKERAVFLAEAAIRAAGSFALPVLHGDTLVIFKPKSIAFAKLSHTEFCRLSDDVGDVIKAETGLDPEQVLSETEKAA